MRIKSSYRISYDKKKEKKDTFFFATYFITFKNMSDIIKNILFKRFNFN